jgi:HEAT repeat protein
MDLGKHPVKGALVIRFTFPFALLAMTLVGALAPAQNLKPLLKKLDSKKADVRFDALMQLADLGPKAAPATDKLIGLLTRFDENDRVPAILALGKIGKPALPALEKLLTHEDELTRHDAVWAMALIGKDAKQYVPELLRMARHDSDEDVRVKAIYAVAQIVPGDPDTMKALIKLERDLETPADTRVAIYEHLSDWGEPAIVPLAETLRADLPNIGAQSALAKILDKHRTKSALAAMVPHVVDAYRQASNQPPMQFNLAMHQWSQKFFMWPTPPGVSELCDGEAMSFVVKAASAKVFPALEAKTLSKDAAERKQAIAILGMMGQTLVAHAEVEHPPITVMTMSGPMTFVPANETPKLIERLGKKLEPFLKHSDPETRAAAVAACLHLPKLTETVLAQALVDDEPAVRASAFNWLIYHGTVWQSALQERMAKAKGTGQLRLAAALYVSDTTQEVLWSHLAHQDAALKIEAAYHIAMNQSLLGFDEKKIRKRLVPVLLEGLASGDAAHRRRAVEAAHKSALYIDDRCEPGLLAALKDKDAQVRQNAVGALRSRSSEDRKDILPAVRPFLRDPDWDTRVYAIHCFSHSRKAGLPDLLKLFEEEKDKYLRQQLIQSLQQQDDPRAFDAILKAAEDPELWSEAARALLFLDQKKSLPKLLAILGKRDEAWRKTLAELPKMPATMDGAALAIVPLLKHDDVRVNRDAAQALPALLKLMWQPDMKTWPMPAQKALEQRLSGLKIPLRAKDVKARREVVELLVEFQKLQRAMEPNFHRAMKKEELELYDASSGNREAIDGLLAEARRDPDLSIRRAARKALVGAIWEVPR